MQQMTISGAAAMLGVRTEAVRRAAADGRLPHAWRHGKYGPERIFEVEDVREYRERRDARYRALLATNSGANE